MKTCFCLCGFLWIIWGGAGSFGWVPVLRPKPPAPAALHSALSTGQPVDREERPTGQIVLEAENQRLLPQIRYDSLVPYKPIPYWEYRLQLSIDHAVLGSGGTQPDPFFRIYQVRTPRGVLPGCQPASCVEYVVAHDRNQNQLWDTEDRLRQFLGPIDNIHEAMLLARLSGFSLEPLGKIPPTYTQDSSGFTLFLTKVVKECPRTLHRFQVQISKEGEVQATDLGLQESPVMCAVK